jgi:hypothetical protein
MTPDIDNQLRVPAPFKKFVGKEFGIIKVSLREMFAMLDRQHEQHEQYVCTRHPSAYSNLLNVLAVHEKQVYRAHCTESVFEWLVVLSKRRPEVQLISRTKVFDLAKTRFGPCRTAPLNESEAIDACALRLVGIAMQYEGLPADDC